MAEEVDDLCLNGHIQGANRLVCHQKLRLHTQSARDGNPLALPAGELGRVFVQIHFIQAHVFHLKRSFLAVGTALWRHTRNAHGLGNDVADLHSAVEARRGVLKDHLPRGLQELFVCGKLSGVRDVDALIENLPGARLDQIHDAARRRRLSGAGLADQTVNLAPADGKRQPVERAHAGSFAEIKFVCDVSHIQQCVSHGELLRSAA